MEERFSRKACEIIRQERKQKEACQDFMAAKLNVGQSTYQKKEKGSIKLSAFELIRIMAVLEVPVEVLQELIELCKDKGPK